MRTEINLDKETEGRGYSGVTYGKCSLGYISTGSTNSMAAPRLRMVILYYRELNIKVSGGPELRNRLDTHKGTVEEFMEQILMEVITFDILLKTLAEVRELGKEEGRGLLQYQLRQMLGVNTCM